MQCFQGAGSCCSLFDQQTWEKPARGRVGESRERIVGAKGLGPEKVRVKFLQRNKQERRLTGPRPKLEHCGAVSE